MKINIIDLLYSIKFNIQAFPLKTALKIPVLISHNTKVEGVYKGCIKLKSPVKPFMLTLGIFRGTGDFRNNSKSYLYIEKNGRMIINSYANICTGFFISIYDNAKITIGNNCWLNTGCTIRCANEISIGNSCLFGWNINIYDSDGHSIYYKNNPELCVNCNKKIIIGNHVWIGANATIAKGARIPNNCILAGHSLINKSFEKSNCIYAGIPAKLVKENIIWSKNPPCQYKETIK